MTAPLSPAPALTAEEAAREHLHRDVDEFATPGHLHHWHGVGSIVAGDMGDDDLRSEHRRMHAARPAEPTGELREQVARWLQDNTLMRNGCYWYSSEPDLNRYADALLSGPLAPLLARAAEAEAERDYWKTEAITVTSMAPVAHNHTRFRNDAGPWSPCPVSCPAAGLLR